jgi:hypothetical protein
MATIAERMRMSVISIIQNDSCQADDYQTGGHG